MAVTTCVLGVQVPVVTILVIQMERVHLRFNEHESESAFLMR